MEFKISFLWHIPINNLIMIKIKYLIMITLVSGITGFAASGQNVTQCDEDISRIVSKLQQYPGRTNSLDDLKTCFDLANQADQERIRTLLSTGQPDIWFDIYQAYLKMDNRQKMIMKLPEKTINQAGIVFTDYKKSLSESKYKAATYLHAHGEKLLQSEKPGDARQAYIELLQVASLDNSYKNLDKLIRKAILKGATNVEFEMHNRTHKTISPAMTDQLSIIIWEFKKAKYGQVKPTVTDKSFSFTLRVILDNLEIGPDQVRDLQYQEERDVYQGDQVVDTISCLIDESRQLKKAQLIGSLEYYDNQTGQVVNRIPIKVESVFTNAYATLQGNPAAAGEATVELLRAKKAAYPSDEQMILDATQEFSRKAGEIILAE
jgi:hypothetical protein